MSQMLQQESTKSTTDSEWTYHTNAPVASVLVQDVPQPQKKWWQRSSQKKQVQPKSKERTTAEIIRYVMVMFGLNLVGQILTRNGEQWLKINVTPLIPANMGWLNGIAWFVMVMFAAFSIGGIIVFVIFLWRNIHKKRLV